MSYHTIIIVGRLGRDPEMRYTPGGKPVTTFSVATDSKHGDEKTTIWFRVTVWDKLAEVCNTSLSKGEQVLVEGRMAPDPTTGGPRVWEKDGKASASYEVVAGVVRFLSPKEADELENY